MGAEIFHELKAVLKKKGYATSVGDEGGFAPNLRSNEEAIETILEAITKAGFSIGTDCLLAFDPAASEFYDGQVYVFKKSDKRKLTSEQMVSFWQSWCEQYPIISIEDGMAENDWEGWKLLTDDFGRKGATGWRRSIRDQHCVSSKRNRPRRCQFNSDQGQSDWHAY